MIDSQRILFFFNQLNNSGLDYILIRNINEELPFGLKKGKDIDLLVKKQDEDRMRQFLFINKYKETYHPHSKDVFLYSADKCIMFQSVDDKNEMIDVNFKILVKSLDAGQWVPLDHVLQESFWVNRYFFYKNKDFAYWKLGDEDEFVLLVARSIFDKKCFTEGYVKRIKELWPLVNTSLIEEKFNKIFFKFSSYLMDLLAKESHQDIIKNYLTFVRY